MILVPDLIEARKSLGWSIRQAGRQAGMSRGAVWGAERNWHTTPAMQEHLRACYRTANPLPVEPSLHTLLRAMCCPFCAVPYGMIGGCSTCTCIRELL